MFKKLRAMFTGTSTAAKESSSTASPAERALLRQIEERSKTDPLIGAKIGCKEVTQRLLDAMKTDRGVHIESLLCALGALAGYSCQAAVRAKAVAQGLTETSLLMSVETTDGTKYFFGDHLNKPLAETQYSVWSISGGGAQQAGCNSLPDLTEIFEHSAQTFGTDAFGIPRVPESHRPHDLPVNYVRTMWPALRPIVLKFCPNPEHWPILLSMSIQDVIVMGKQTLDPCLSLRLVMETAVPMSKVNLSAP